MNFFILITTKIICKQTPLIILLPKITPSVGALIEVIEKTNYTLISDTFNY